MKNFIKNQIFIPIFSLVLLLVLSGCGKRDYKTLHNFNTRPYDLQQEQNNLHVGIKKIEEKEFKAIFPNTNSFKRKSVYKNFQVLNLNIYNKNDINYLIDSKNITPTPYSYKEMDTFFERKYNTVFIPAIPLVTPYVILSGYSASVAFLFATGRAGFCCAGLIISGSLFILSSLSVAAILTPFICARNKAKKAQIYNLATLKNLILDPYEQTYIQAHSELNKILFINKKSLKDTLSISLTTDTKDKDKEVLTFDFDILI